MEDFDSMLRNLILEEIASGIKATQLAANVPKRIYEDSRYAPYRESFSKNPDKMFVITRELIDKSDIKEIEYIFPNINSERIKSFYLPSDAIILNYTCNYTHKK